MWPAIARRAHRSFGDWSADWRANHRATIAFVALLEGESGDFVPPPG
jgi:hypothetical protein